MITKVCVAIKVNEIYFLSKFGSCTYVKLKESYGNHLLLFSGHPCLILIHLIIEICFYNGLQQNMVAVCAHSIYLGARTYDSC